MEIKTLTYNLNFGKAWNKIGGIIKSTKPDIIALQEINTADENLIQIRKYGYELAEYSNSKLKFNNIFGIATFYRKEKLSFIRASSFDLPFGIHEIFQFFLFGGRRQRTVLKTEFQFKSNKKLNLWNVHFSAFTMNRLRIKQLEETLEHLKNDIQPTIMLGDFNYPYGRKKLEELFDAYDLKEATTNVHHTFKSTMPFMPVKFKLDYIFYKNLKHVETSKIDTTLSDHLPIVSVFNL